MLDQNTLASRICFILEDYRIDITKPIHQKLAQKLWITARAFGSKTRRTPYNVQKGLERYKKQAKRYIHNALKK